MVLAELSVGNSGCKIWISSLYLDKEEDINMQLARVDRILSEVSKSKNGQPCLLAMDSNCRSKSWFDRLTDKRGSAMELYIASKSFHLLNEDLDIPTFNTKNGSSNIDLTIVNDKCLKYISNWNIDLEESASDHNFITFEITNLCSKLLLNNDNFIFNTHKANWDLFEQSLKNNLMNCTYDIRNNHEFNEQILTKSIKECIDLDEEVKNIDIALRKACLESIPIVNRSKFSGEHKTVSWWTRDLTVLRKEVNLKRRHYQRIKNNTALRDTLKNDYYSIKYKYKKMLKKAKLKSWKEFCTNTNINNPWGLPYKVAAGKTKPASFLSTILTDDGSYTSNLDETVQALMNHFFPEDTLFDDTMAHSIMRQNAKEEINTEDDSPFTYNEIKLALSNFRPNKTPGEDRITNLILQKIFSYIPQLIITIFNECLKRGTFPTVWKSCKVIPITKPGKENHNMASKFRPICLLSSAGKLLEKLLINRILHHLNKNNHLSERQYGFKPQSSTIDALLAVKNFVESNLANKKKVLLVSLDVEGAFDAAWWPAVLCQLRQFQCPANLYKLSKSYFSNRIAHLKLGTCSVKKDITRGCPQGSCSGPGFWNIQFDSLLKLNYPLNSEVVAYADDYLFMLSGRNIYEMELQANSVLELINSWAIGHKIKFSKEKSCVMYIAKRYVPRSLELFLGDFQLKYVEQLKYLGITLSCNWKWNDHINCMTDKSLKFINALSKSAKVHWGLGQDALEIIYKGAFLPSMTYAACIWVDGLKTKINKKKINSVQRKLAIRLIRGYRTISHEAACLLAGVTPLCIYIHQVAQIELVRRGKEANGLSAADMEIPMSTKLWHHPSTMENLKICEIDLQLNDPPPGCNIFTDGSKLENGVGCAFIVYMNEEVITERQYRLKSWCSNNQAEMLAIEKALNWLEHQNDYISDEVYIFTDSKISLQSLADYRKQTPLVFKAREQLEKIKNRYDVHFCWTKAHVGTSGNEQADSLAKTAATSLQLEEVYNKYPITYLRKLLEDEAKRSWDESWKTSVNGSITRQFFPTLSHRLSLKNWKPSYKMTQLLSGHGKIRSYLHRFGILEHGSCLCDLTQEQTVDHLLFDCILLEPVRAPLIRHLLITLNHHWPPSDKSIFLQENCIQQFKEFIKNIDLEII